VIGKLGKKLGFGKRPEPPDMDWKGRNRELADIIKAGDIAKARELAQELLEYAERRFPKDAPEKASACNNMGMALMMDREYELADECFREALDMRKRILGPRHREVALVCLNLVELYRLQAQSILLESSVQA
jgi:tetratricopeptide (TPR) repeat protein